jgi:hypothetical protein
MILYKNQAIKFALPESLRKVNLALGLNKRISSLYNATSTY